MDDNIVTMNINDWVICLNEPEGEGPFPVFLLLHGWTGDDKSMWIFSSRLPNKTLMIAPRGIYPTPLGGYGWYPIKVRGLPGDGREWPHVGEFRPTINALLSLLTPQNFPNGDFSRLNLVGFSQGAALSYTFALLYPNKINTLAGLSGFMPRGASDLAENQSLKGKSVFVTHGTQDDLVPVAMARQAVEILEDAGAGVTYCEHNVGHKLNTICFKAMEKFFSEWD